MKNVNLIEWNNSLTNILIANESAILGLINGSIYPKIGKALLSFGAKSDSICKSIILLEKEKVIYPIFICYRALIEHYLVSYYIFTRFDRDKSDKVGEEYYINYFMLEFTSSQNTPTSIEEISRDKNNGLIKERYPELNEFLNNQEQVQNELYRIGNNFKVKKIIEFLNTIEAGEHVMKLNSLLINTIKEYYEFSSFVHGGPTAEKLLKNEIGGFDLSEQLVRITEMSNSYNKTIKNNILLFMGTLDNRYFDIYLELNQKYST